MAASASSGLLMLYAWIREQFADADDEVGKPFACGPMIAHADCGRINVRMKHGRQHPAMRGETRIVRGELDFDAVKLTGDGLIVLPALEAAHEILDFVQIGWIAGRFDHSDEGK